MLVPLASEERIDPCIQFDDFILLETLSAAYCSEVFQIVYGKILRECREEHLLPICRSVLRQPLCPVHGKHCLTSAGTTENAHRSGSVAGCKLPLGWMQKHEPLGQRGVQDRSPFLVVVHHEASRLRL